MNYRILKFIIIAFCLLTQGSLIFGQIENKNIEIQFEELKKDGRNYVFLNLLKESDLSIVKNIPSETNNFILYKVVISNFHSMYENFINKEISEEKFLYYIDNIGVDSSYINKIRIPQSFFYVYVGIDLKEQKKYVAIDTNMDNNLRNDSLYTFNLSDYSKYNLQENPLDVKTKLQFSYEIENIKKSSSIPLALFPFYSDKRKEDYSNITDYYLDIGLFGNTTKEASLNIQGKPYKIIAYKENQSDFLPWILNKKSHFDIYDNNGSRLYNHLSIEDTIIIADKKIKLETVNKNKLVITEIDNFSIMDSNIYVHSLNNNDQITLQNEIQDKYVFIDFWGSWCNPCLHSIPLIKQLYEKTKHRKDVLILGIALENEKDINTLKNIILEKQILYPNYYAYTQDVKSINYPHAAFQVTQFPTYLILDKKSNVIHKITNSNNTEKAISLFIELIESNY